ncbi:hypothetical protein Acor_13730 [Acrocarpospora corrugata]|uniref:Uncharacterized protein n=1 Tax=Acrocarpospora corrugata TaxID=35763 RepID=A0A5M3VTT3_9ACTN|nr:hypothetical protein Acor_13730 [Acrocarpospora corrugata]
MRDVHGFPYPPIDGRIIRVSARAHPVQRAGGDRVQGGEQRHIDATRDEPFGQQTRDLLPGPVVKRRRTPRDRPQKGDLHERDLTVNDWKDRLSVRLIAHLLVCSPFIVRPLRRFCLTSEQAIQRA